MKNTSSEEKVNRFIKIATPKFANSSHRREANKLFKVLAELFLDMTHKQLRFVANATTDPRTPSKIRDTGLAMMLAVYAGSDLSNTIDVETVCADLMEVTSAISAILPQDGGVL